MRAALVLALGLALTGCFQIHSTITVRPDGSAVVEDRIELSGMMAEMMMAADEGGKGSGVNKARLQARAAALGEGVTLLGVVESGTGYTARYGVPDVRVLRFTTADPDLGDDPDAPTVADEAVDLTFDFEPGETATLRILVPESGGPEADDPGADDPGADGENEETDPAETARNLRMARALLGDARMTVAVVLDGEVVETDAAYADGATVTVFDVLFDTLFDVVEERPDLLRGNAPPFDELREVVGDRDGIAIQPPGTVTVRFQ